jgi:hypothetical protein
MKEMGNCSIFLIDLVAFTPILRPEKKYLYIRSCLRRNSPPVGGIALFLRE